MKKFLIALLAFVSLSASADVAFNDWTVPFGKEHSYHGQVNNGYTTEFKLGLGWFTILEYPTGSEDGRFNSASASSQQLVYSVNGTRVKFTIKKDNKGWWMAYPTTKKGWEHILDCFWNSKTVTFVSMENGHTIKVSASGVQRAYKYILNNQAI